MVARHDPPPDHDRSSVSWSPTLVLVGAWAPWRWPACGPEPATTTAELRRQAAELADAMTDTLTAGLDTTADADVLQRTITRRVALLRRFGRLLELDDIALVAVDRRGRIEASCRPASMPLGARSRRAAGRRGAATATADRWCGPSPRLPTVPRTGSIRSSSSPAYASRGLGDGVPLVRAVAAVLTLGLGAGGGVGARPAADPPDPRREPRRRIGSPTATSTPGSPTPGRRSDELAELADSINTMAGGAGASPRASSRSSCCRSPTTCGRR